MDKLLELFKELKNEWKIIIISIILISLLWYLSFFIYNRKIITDYSFYVPIILSFSLSILWYPLLLMEASIMLFIVRKNVIDKGVSFLLYTGLLASVIVLCLSIYSDLKINKLTTLKEFIFKNFESGIIIISVLVIVLILVSTIRNIIDSRKTKKENI